MRSSLDNRGPLITTIGLLLVSGLLVATLVVEPLLHYWSQLSSPQYDIKTMVFIHATLPRLTMAMLCGVALGASGAILQQVLRNPLASPSTLGIDAGARPALTIATLFAPQLIGFGRDLVALAGSTITTLIVFAVVQRRGFSALAIVLTGLIISLYCGALSSILILVGDRYMASLFIWGSGSLALQSWVPVHDLLVRVGLTLLPLFLLLRPLALLDTDEKIAAARGINVASLRVAAIAIAVALSAFVTSIVGVFGFIGLVAPIMARLTGARRFPARLLYSALFGGLLLLITDAAVQVFASDTNRFLPTGALTAVLASPLLLYLLPRLKSFDRSAFSLRKHVQRGQQPGRARQLPATVAGMLVIALFALALLLGRSPVGDWEIALFAADISSWQELWNHLLVWRAPRMLAAACAGALLAVAGLILQRLTGNEMASPEVLGVSAGAIFTVAISLLMFNSIGGVGLNIAAVLGGFAVLGLILMIGRQSGFAPERVLIAGIALNALVDAVIGLLTSSGDPHAITLLGWMSGATGGTTMAELATVATAAAVLIPAALLTSRWLDILPLGTSQSAALGVPVGRARLCLLVLAATLTSFATFIIGPLTFVGLMAPHIVMFCGIYRARTMLLLSALTGAVLMAVTDTLARTVAFPLQLPTGLTAAVIGAPFLLFLLSHRRLKS